ncbi:MAG: HAD family acid phosphatase [Pseudomonadota bacterium]
MRILGAMSLLPALGGCIAAAIPIAASSAIVKKRMDQKRGDRSAPLPVPQQPMPSGSAGTIQTAGGQWQRVDGATGMPAPSGATPTAATASSRAVVPETMQYLYGSGEGAALSVQAYAALTNYLRAQVIAARSTDLRQVVLADGASLNAPRYEPCGKKPLAAVFDIDETALLNLGYEADAARRGGGFDDARWQRWEATGATKVVAVPGATVAIAAARKAGVTVIFNSNRTREQAAATAEALDHAGLGPVKHGTTLWLKGDDGGGSGKDDRRWAIASGYCVIALVGDQLGDFSDLFNDGGLAPSTRRMLAAGPELAPMWGNGWFMLPNPVYGTALKGGFDEIFPVDTRWTDPGETSATPTPVPPK